MGEIADEHINQMMDGFDGEHEGYMGDWIRSTFLIPNGLMSRSGALRAGYWIDATGLCERITDLDDGRIIAIIKNKKKNGKRIPKQIKDEFNRRNTNGWMELIA